MTAIAYTADPALAFWPTPPEVAEDLVLGAICPGFGDGAASKDGEVPQVRVLEPSAGDGHLIRAVRAHLPYAHVTAVEPSAQRSATLRAAGTLADEVAESTLEDYLTAIAFEAMADTFHPFDLVVMNPPFALDGHPEAWAEHFLAVYNDPYLVVPGGTIGAVVPRIVMTGKSKLVRSVRDLLHPYYGMQDCERGAFKDVGAQVSTALIWAHKELDPSTTGSNREGSK